MRLHYLISTGKGKPTHFQIRRDVSGYTIRKSEGSRTSDGRTGVAYEVPYKNVNEKLLHLSHR
jgi:hypothetical protein